ncbi:Alcohol dehydrogenase, class IV, partial [Oscillibacter sp. PC13]|uniref:iron-containing alcohol dehydrogenase n=1 Tax=Oscillibacter sp. PC13 TaxID=1855299 RepID=UPI0008E20A3A
QRMGKKALIVTDSMMVELGNCAKVEKVLADAGIHYTVFDRIGGEPTDLMVRDGLGQYKAEGCDFLIALGGGSPLDTMKSIGVLEADGGDDITVYMGKEITVPVPPMVAIPTTAGTGSEATQFSIINDTKNNIKMLLKGKVMLPDLAIVDPQFTMTAPPRVTVNTGLDALCHAVEAYTSRKAQTMSDVFAVSAVKRIFKSLPVAFDDGKNEDARIEMSIAALEAGIAFNNASVTLIHGMSRPIGALFHIAHGMSNAILMNVCLRFAVSGAYDRFGQLGREIGVATAQDDDKTAAEKFLDALDALTAELQAPTLASAGVNRDEFFACIDKMAHDAMDSGSPQNTMRDMTEEDVKELYKQLW